MLLNQWMGTGRLGRDPEMSYTPQGTAVTKFSIAVDQGKDKPAMWLNIVTWERLAERINEQACKGSEVFVQGKLMMRSYTDRNGQNRQAFEVSASTVQLTQRPQVAATSSADFEELGDPSDHPF
ncbi:single-stranded DNA-binding protein [Dictyobacter arantiisoli]|uniref:Single-stranded DNA-binding protein n=1 Tax=Dictyobacter arantiisoli TaxID=2014874 RepID=A0A5A5T9L6_9CHLR|nr:single-stranded DNA-binding protein [Dictyobacter arantiisoli]GCF08088.1 hypothetical protein KDI_16520 [Dictyobacter arantiisoli]